MCDIPDKVKKAKPAVKKIEDDNEEEEIITGGKKNLGKKAEDVHDDAPQGRRGESKGSRDKNTDFVPRKAYAKNAGSMDMDDDFDLDNVPSKSKKSDFKSHVTKASDADDEADNSSSYSPGN